MGYQHAVYPLVHGSTQHLCPEIGTAVYQYHRIVRMQQADARKRLSRGSADVQTGHVQPISGTPVDVPLPNIVSFIKQ